MISRLLFASQIILYVQMKKQRKPLTYIQSIYKSGSDEYTYLKSMIGFLIGIGTTACFHVLTTKGLDFTHKSHLFLTAIVGSFFCIGGILTVQFRCIMLLMLPTFIGKSCRRLLIVLAISQLAQGPIQNIFINIEETVRMFYCAGEMAINMTLHRMELVFRPIHDIVRALMVAGNDIESHMTSIADGFYPLFLMVEDNRKVGERLAKLKSISGMQHLVDKVTNKLKNFTFKTIDDDVDDEEELKPSEKLSLKIQSSCLKLIAGPLKICEQLDDKLRYHFNNLGMTYEGSCPPEITSFCDNFQELGDEFDGAYETIKSLINKLDEALDINIDFYDIREILDLQSVEYVKENIEDEMLYRVKIADFVSDIFHRFLGFLFIIVFISAAQYEAKYMSIISYDNRYVTSYFKKIDKRRKAQNKTSLLPLKRLEKLELLSSMNWRLLPQEKRELMLSITQVLPHFLIAIVAFGFDWLLVFLLGLVAKHAKLDFQGKGDHEIFFEVHGNSFLAEQWRNLFHTNTYKHEVEMNFSSQNCIPKVSHVKLEYILEITAIYVFLIVSSRIEAHGLRLRRFVCSLCYYKREKTRVLWLYNSFLKRRVGMLEFEKQQQLNKFTRWNEIERNSKLLLVIREKYPKYCHWLRIFKAAQRECLLCREYEAKTSYRCMTCRNTYCDECWNYLNVKKNILTHIINIDNFFLTIVC
ncbi:hypothetical protein CHUAL_011500 [Chamberlinius hualienensis]